MRKYESIVSDSVFSKFNDIKGSSLMNHAFNSCTIENHLSVASVLFPEIVEENGCIFISEFYNGNYDSLHEQFEGDRYKIERYVNSWSVGDFFLLSRDESVDNDEIFDEFCKLLKYCWSVRFNELFPDKKIVVEIGNAIAGESGITITAYQV